MCKCAPAHLYAINNDEFVSLKKKHFPTKDQTKVSQAVHCHKFCTLDTEGDSILFDKF